MSDEISYPLEVAQERQAYIEQLEQQLIDMREELHIALAQRQNYRAHLAEALALLLRSNDLLQPGFGATDDEREQHAKEIRAFLAQHKE